MAGGDIEIKSVEDVRGLERLLQQYPNHTGVVHLVVEDLSQSQRRRMTDETKRVVEDYNRTSGERRLTICVGRVELAADDDAGAGADFM